jgi:hypothetical protein
MRLLVISSILLLSFAATARAKAANQKANSAGRRRQIADLFQKATTALSHRSYEEAIQTAEQIRRIPSNGDTRYLNEAKQIIDKSRMQQKEEFEPFLIQARERFDQGDFQSSYDLCTEMNKLDPGYQAARECMQRAEKYLRRSALIDATLK